jgi:hypothetical protein
MTADQLNPLGSLEPRPVHSPPTLARPDPSAELCEALGVFESLMRDHAYGLRRKAEGIRQRAKARPSGACVRAIWRFETRTPERSHERSDG